MGTFLISLLKIFPPLGNIVVKWKSSEIFEYALSIDLKTKKKRKFVRIIPEESWWLVSELQLFIHRFLLFCMVKAFYVVVGQV